MSKHDGWQTRRARGVANSVEANRHREPTVIDWPSAIARLHAILDGMDADERTETPTTR